MLSLLSLLSVLLLLVLMLLLLELHVLQQHRSGELILGLLTLRLLHELHLLYLLHRVCLLLLQVLRLLLLLHGRSKQQLRSRRAWYGLQRRETMRVRWRRDDEASTVVRLTRRRSISGCRAWPYSPRDASFAARLVAPQRQVHGQQRRGRAAASAVIPRGL